MIEILGFILLALMIFAFVAWVVVCYDEARSGFRSWKHRELALKAKREKVLDTERYVRHAEKSPAEREEWAKAKLEEWKAMKDARK